MLINIPLITSPWFLKSNFSSVRNREFKHTEARSATKKPNFCKMWETFHCSQVPECQKTPDGERNQGGRQEACLQTRKECSNSCPGFYTLQQSNAPSGGLWTSAALRAPGPSNQILGLNLLMCLPNKILFVMISHLIIFCSLLAKLLTYFIIIQGCIYVSLSPHQLALTYRGYFYANITFLCYPFQTHVR